MIIYLAGGETWDKLLAECGVPYILASYYYLRDKGYGITERILENFDKVFLDSGAFTLRQHLRIRDVSEDYIHEETERYLDEYAYFLDLYGAEFDRVAEVDVGVWQQKTRYRERLLDKINVDVNLVPVVHRRDPDRYVEFLCKKYDYVAYASLHGYSKSDIMNYMNRRLIVAKRYGTPIHGFAITTPELIMRMGFASVDSATWVHSIKHGMTFYFDGRTFHMYDNRRKWVRAEFKREVKDLGLSWNNFMDDIPDTVLRFNIAQWLKFQEHLDTEGKGLNRFKTSQEKFWRDKVREV